MNKDAAFAAAKEAARQWLRPLPRLEGTGRVSSVISGALILGVANSIINLSGVSPYLQGTLKGSIILIAVALSQVNFKTIRSGR